MEGLCSPEWSVTLLLALPGLGLTPGGGMLWRGWGTWCAAGAWREAAWRGFGEPKAWCGIGELFSSLGPDLE